MLNSDSAVTRISGLRVAIVHYWFVGRAGGERVVEALAELLPQADLFCLVADRNKLGPVLRDRKLETSFLQRVPGATRFHRHFLFLQPLALEQFDLSGYDLVISSESGPAKGVITSARTCHICYCHSPMRYIWDMYARYKSRMNPLSGLMFALVAHYMRFWDIASAKRVDYFVANSRFVASRIRNCYGRESTVIHPPVDSKYASVDDSFKDYYLTVGRLVDYKRFDLAVKACTELGIRLRVIGIGPERKKLERMAGPTIEFLGHVDDQQLRTHLAGCRALIYPGEEDFGIVPVEAQSFGRPVIAYGSGGALETVLGYKEGEIAVKDATGLFFIEQSVSSLVSAIHEFESIESQFSPQAIHEHSHQFDVQVFKSNMAEFIDRAMADFRSRKLGSNLPGIAESEH